MEVFAIRGQGPKLLDAHGAVRDLRSLRSAQGELQKPLRNERGAHHIFRFALHVRLDATALAT